jgi:hypothetical protein
MLADRHNNSRCLLRAAVLPFPMNLIMPSESALTEILPQVGTEQLESFAHFHPIDPFVLDAWRQLMP